MCVLKWPLVFYRVIDDHSIYDHCQNILFFLIIQQIHRNMIIRQTICIETKCLLSVD